VRSTHPSNWKRNLWTKALPNKQDSYSGEAAINEILLHIIALSVISAKTNKYEVAADWVQWRLGAEECVCKAA
jgi:hypothetical protein